MYNLFCSYSHCVVWLFHLHFYAVLFCSLVTIYTANCHQQNEKPLSTKRSAFNVLTIFHYEHSSEFSASQHFACCYTTDANLLNGM